MVGQQVRVFIVGLWLPGTIEFVCVAPYSYNVRLADGRVFRRTRRDINVNNSVSAGFGVVRPIVASTALPTLVWQPPLRLPAGPTRPAPILLTVKLKLSDAGTTILQAPPVDTTRPSHELITVAPRRGRPPKVTHSASDAAQLVQPPGTSAMAVCGDLGATRSGRP